MGMQEILAKEDSVARGGGGVPPSWARGMTARHAPLASEQLLLDNIQRRKPLVLSQSTMPVQKSPNSWHGGWSCSSGPAHVAHTTENSWRMGGAD